MIEHLQGLLAAGGEGIITDKAKIYSAMSDWIRATELGQPEEYLIDPASEEAQAVSQQNSARAQQQAEQMERMNQVLMQQQRQIEDQKIELDRWKHQTDLAFKYYDANLDAETKEAELTQDMIKDANQSARNENVQ